MAPSSPSSPSLKLGFFPPLLPHGRQPSVADRTPSLASSHGALHGVPSPLFSLSGQENTLPSFPLPQHAKAPCCSLRPTLPWKPAGAPFPPWPAPHAAPLRDSPSPNSESSSSLFSMVPTGCLAKCAASRALQQPSRSISTPLVACRRSRARCVAPSATPSKPMVRKPLLPLLLSHFFVCSVKMLNRCVCLITASGRRHTSRLARSTKCRAMWTAHASSPDSFRLIEL
jgi:hypothetical protein